MPTEPPARTASGTVLSSGGGTYEVALSDGTTVEAVLRGRIKLEDRTGQRVVAGDRVRVQVRPDGGHTIEKVEPRRSQLARRAPGRGHARAKVVIANVDQVVIVLAAARPEPRLRMLDRFLVLAESNELASLIVINKIDLVDRTHVRSTFAAHAAAGYPILETSALEGTGIEALRDRLCGRESVMTGPSGAGKSSLLNALEPGLGLRVGALIERVGRGRHTTTTARLVPLECGGFVADTPGLREVGLWGVDRDTLDAMFPEFRPFAGACRFGTSCKHTHEPDCAVREAVAQNEIDAGRFASYESMYEGEEGRA